MTNLLNGIMNDAYTLLIGALILMAIVFVIMTWSRTRSFVPTLGAVVFGVVIIAGVTQYRNLRAETEDDINEYITTDNTPLADQ
jgi:protein-S-isoprenylcysteine O-methyltransferase Ste14